MKYCIMFALCALLAGCMGGGGSGDIPVPPPEYYAIQEYEQIAPNANLLLSTDRISWVPGRAAPERVSVECRGMFCSVGYSAFFRSNRVVHVEAENLALLPDTNGISTALAYFSGNWADVHSYVGWMEHSFFASTAHIYTQDVDPDQGVVQTFGTVTGNTTHTNPEMEATWTGFVSARDDTAGTIDLGSYITGDASISVSIGEQVLVDVYLTGMANVTTGKAYTDVTHEGMPVIDGQFSRYHADDDRLSGVFYGPNHEEVGGVFEHPQGLLGAYGGMRQ